MEAEELLKRRIKELAQKAYQQSIYTNTAFLSLAEQSLYYESQKEISYILGRLEGGYPYAERRVLIFGSQEAFGYEAELPIACLKIEPLAPKFCEPLTHRDYLGAILNLGIERECIGDILVEENKAHLFCMENMADFLQQEITKIKHTLVKVSRAQGEDLRIEPKVKRIEGFLASFRLDAVISLGFSLSRKESASFIQNKRVYINGKLVETNGKNVDEGDIISVRGKGKMIFYEIHGQSKKGRYFVVLHKFI